MAVSIFTAGGATVTAYETDTAESQAQTEKISSGDGVYGDFKYTVSDNNEVTITKYTGSDTEVVIPSTIENMPVVKIGALTFQNCSNLKILKISDSVTSITDNSVFYGCAGLTDIDVSNDNCNYSSKDGVLFDKNKTQLIKYPQGRKDETYAIPNSVTKIYMNAFSSCESLTSIIIPNSVKNIDIYAFFECCNLTSVNIPNGLTSIRQGVFYGCSSLTNITIPNNVDTINFNAFQNCSSLTGVTIPDSVKWIYMYAFKGCSSLTNITIPKNVICLDDFVFMECSSLTDIDVDNENKYYSSQDGVLFNKNKTKILFYPPGKTNVSYTIPDGVTEINSHTFESCLNLTNVTMPDTVTTLGVHAFDNCSNLSSVTMSNSLTSIGDYAFKSCISLINLKIPGSVVCIDDFVFFECSSLTDIDVDSENSCYSSKDGVLFNKNKTQLLFYPSGKTNVSYTIPDGVTDIGDRAFEYCSNLTGVTIPDSVTSIEYGAFEDCSSLTNVTIPNSVTSIEGYAFSGCSSLTGVTILNNETVINYKAFGYYFSYTDNKYKKTDGFTMYGYKGSTTEAYANKNGFAFVDIENEVQNVTLNQTTITLGVDQSYTLVPTTDPEDAETTFTWKSSKKDIATVTSKGKVTGRAVGRATITVMTANGKTATCKVEVKPAPESVSISKTSIKIGVKQKYTLTTTLTPSNAATYCTWSSDNTAVATVSSGGVVTGKKAGTATITVKTTNGKTATCTVSVKKAPIAIALDKTELSLNVDETYTLTRLVPENSAAEYTWSSSDSDVAEVYSDGKVTAKKAGTVVITLTSHNGKTAECRVTIN